MRKHDEVANLIFESHLFRPFSMNWKRPESYYLKHLLAIKKNLDEDILSTFMCEDTISPIPYSFDSQKQ